MELGRMGLNRVLSGLTHFLSFSFRFMWVLFVLLISMSEYVREEENCVFSKRGSYNTYGKSACSCISANLMAIKIEE